MCIGGGQTNLPKVVSSATPLQISQKLPSLASLDAEIADLQKKLAGPMNAGLGMGAQGVKLSNIQRQSLQKSLDQKLAMRRSIVDPSQAAGIPPTPAAPGLFGPRIEAPKVGTNDLKILLPTS